jgi:hypothetical protein
MTISGICECGMVGLVELPDCPFCEGGSLKRAITTIDSVWGEIQDIEYCICSDCGADPILTFQLLKNDIQFSKAINSWKEEQDLESS